MTHLRDNVLKTGPTLGINHASKLLMDPAETQVQQNHIVAHLFPVSCPSSLTYFEISPETSFSIRHFKKILLLSLCLQRTKSKLRGV